MANKILIARGTKERVETIKETLENNEIIYTTDTNELGVKKSDGNVEYFMNSEDINSSLGSKLDSVIIETTYSNLVALRDNEELVSGMFYRITDYETTTTQPNTRSAGHLFDIVIQALSESELAEVGTAVEREGENYFANAGAKLGAWQIWYDINNMEDVLAVDYWGEISYPEYEGIVNIEGVDYRKYYEAYNGFWVLVDINTNDVYYSWDGDSVDGDPVEDGEANSVALINTTHGIITRLIDEKFNDLRYDFKNIQIYLDEDDDWFYTFDNNGEDASLGNDVYDNTIKSKNQSNVFKGNNFNSNTIGNDFRSNTIGNDFRSNTIGNDFRSNTIGNNFNNNTIGNNFRSNTIGNNFNNNTIGNYFNSNTIGNSFYSNTIGNSFYSNTIGAYYRYCQFGESVRYIRLEAGINSSQYQNITVKAGVVGASQNNPLVIEDEAALRNKAYNIEISRSQSGRVLMLWYDDNAVKIGKYKATITSATWADL